MARRTLSLSRIKAVAYTAVVFAVAIAIYLIWTSTPEAIITVSYATSTPGVALPTRQKEGDMLLGIFRMRLTSASGCAVAESGEGTWLLQSGDALSSKLTADVAGDAICSLSLRIVCAEPPITPNNALEEQIAADMQAVYSAQRDAIPIHIHAMLDAFDADARISAATADYWCSLALDTMENDKTYEDKLDGLAFMTRLVQEDGQTVLICSLTVEN